MGKDREILLDNVIVQKIGLDSTDMNGEIVMMDINKGKYYGFNIVGSRIWELIEKPLEVKKIISILLKEFNVDAQTCENSVMTFLNRLYHDNIISIN
ncbi:lasso peptide biosynthesis PqqD family chaperone [Clostridium sp.]|uniref:lasso peptide biosynthesis PqqD family chaperone n=1 Tax=Clostridium sp. TaxID=1506 RepID=UPI003D6D1630